MKTKIMFTFLFSTSTAGKRVVACTFLLMFFLNSYNQQYVQIGFSSDNNVPTSTFDGEFYHLQFQDQSLTQTLNNYQITTYEKEFPAIINFIDTLVPKLNRVYKIRTQSGIQTLYNTLAALTSSSISSLYILDDFIDSTKILHTPNDYVSDFMPCNYCSAPSTYALKQLELINATQAWDITTGNSNIKIGISDAFATITNPDLVNQISGIHPSAIIPVGSPAYPNTFHGPRVAGCAAAQTNNGIGISGIGYNSKLVLLPLGDYNAMLNGFTNYGYKVINCSWLSSCFPVQTHQDVIDVLYRAGATIIAAAGNNSCGNANNLVYPASYNHVISVSSVGHIFSIGESRTCNTTGVTYYGNDKDVHERLRVSSAGNEITTHQHNSMVDIVAPGYDITTTTSSGITLNCNNSGTSFAAPFVSGTAALLYAINERFSPDEIEAILKCTAANIYNIPQNTAYVGKLGAGRLDAFAAVTKATQMNSNKPTDIKWYYKTKTGIYILFDQANLPQMIANNSIPQNTLYFKATAGASNSGSFSWEFIKGNSKIIKTGTLNSFVSLNMNTELTNNWCNLVIHVKNLVSSICDNNASSFYRESGYFVNNPSCTEPYVANKNRVFETTNAAKKDILIYPNPASDLLKITLPESVGQNSAVVVKLFNSLGILVKTESFRNNYLSINTLNLPIGMYLIEIIANKERYQKKILVERK
jgi:Subtilase family/Secretion system C-terminal sorting domain